MKKRRAAYIGPAGVLAYDYGNSSSEDLPASEYPNPILENVPGLLLCYDDLYFLSRDFCPRDMQDLPYVHFLDAVPDLVDRAKTAHVQYQELALKIPLTFPESGGQLWMNTLTAMIGGLRDSIIPDNHSRGISIAPDWTVTGRSGSPELVVVDIGTALALDIDELDVIVSSVGSSVLHNLELFARGHDRSAEFWKISAATNLAEIYTPAYLGPKGAYHLAYEELRSHSRVGEFRDFLRELEPPHRDGERLAREISHLADRHASDVLERFVKGKNKFRSVGLPVLGSALNTIIPGASSAVTATNSTLEYLADSRLRKKVSWAPFVVDLRKKSTEHFVT